MRGETLCAPSAIMRCWPCCSVVAFVGRNWSVWSWTTSRCAKDTGPLFDLIGKGGHIRTVPIPNWVKAALDQWTRAAGVCEGKIFRAVARRGKVWGSGLSQNVVWYVVRTCCERAGLEHIAPHDLRRTCAKLCHTSGGELEQIQFLLGHASVQTTERYLGCKQNLGRCTR